MQGIACICTAVGDLHVCVCVYVYMCICVYVYMQGICVCMLECEYYAKYMKCGECVVHGEIYHFLL